MRGGFILLAAGVISAALAAPGQACSVPVFRYALERWGADRFETIIFHSGKLSEAQEAVAGGLETAAQSRGAMMNLLVQRVSVKDGGAEQYPALWKEQVEVGAALPWVVIRYPATFTGEEKKVMWSGKLQAADVSGLLQSPARMELARRLIEGEAIVWVL